MSAERASVVLLGTGVVGGAFKAQVEAGPLAESISLVRAINRRANVPPEAWLDHLASLPNPVIVDATAADGMEALYLRAFRAGIHVVTANKKPLVCPLATRDALFATLEAARTRVGAPVRFRYEATVGAGLPVIETLKDFIRTGDDVRRIDCVLSGTLGFVCDELAKGTPLSRVVAAARERGYTEPDPREDLGGEDVARKAVILARELGASLEVGDVACEPFVADPRLAAAAPADVERALEPLDAELARRIERHVSRGERLVYLARIEKRGASIAPSADGATRAPSRPIVVASAGPVAVRADHPAASLRGPRALVAFTTERYTEPLVISGAGAGGAVTAAAVAADVLKIVGV